VRRIAGECIYVDERGAVGIRLEPAAAIDENQDGTRGSNLLCSSGESCANLTYSPLTGNHAAWGYDGRRIRAPTMPSATLNGVDLLHQNFCEPVPRAYSRQSRQGSKNVCLIMFYQPSSGMPSACQRNSRSQYKAAAEETLPRGQRVRLS
jgi:hypothetical protein